MMMAVYTHAGAEGAISQSGERIGQDIQNAQGQLESAGRIIARIIACGNRGEVLTADGRGCTTMQEADSQMLSFAKNVPSCGPDEVLVNVGRTNLACRLISDFDYIHYYDSVSGNRCTTVPPENTDRIYCRCGNWMNRSAALAVSSCS